MGMKISGSLDLAGVEVVLSLPIGTDAFKGRVVQYAGTLYHHDGTQWQAIPNTSSGVLPIQTPAEAGKILSTDGTAAVWQPQYPAGTAGKFLQTNGSGVVSWQDPPASLPAQGGHTDEYLTTDGTATSWGKVKRASVQTGTAGQVVYNDGTTGALSSEATLNPKRGGLGLDATGLSGFPKATAGSFAIAPLAAGDMPTGIPAANISGGTVSNAEFDLLDGMTGSPIQTQLNSKLDKTAGGTVAGNVTFSGTVTVNDPSALSDVASKNYVDNVAAGLRVKDAVKCATTANVALSGLQTIDGYTLVASDRVLVKSQTNAFDNGIYVAAAGAWSRSTDGNSFQKLTSAFCYIEKGTLYRDTGWVCTANAGGTLGVNNIPWVQFAYGGVTTNGDGLGMTGNSLYVIPTDSTITVASGGGIKVSDTASIPTPTFTNPSITSYSELTGIAAPGAPGAGKVRLFAGTDGKIYKYANGDAAASIVGGGLVTQLKTTTFTAAQNFAYLCDTSGGGYTATLPAGTAGAVIRFSDDKRTWASANLTIAPATGETIGGLSANDILVCDLSGAFVQLSWDGSRWVVETNGYVGSVSSGTLSTATGMGAKNYLTDTASNWIANTTNIQVATESSAANIPANYTKTSALKITNNGGGTYAYARFTLDQADYGKKFQLSFDQLFAAGTTGAYTLAVWSNTASNYLGTSTQLTLQTSTITALTGSFVTTVDMPGSAAPYIEVRILGVSGAVPLYLNNIYCGPGVQQTGAAISDWQSYAPTLGGFSGTINTAAWKRDGSDMLITFQASLTGAASGNIQVPIPAGYTLNTTAMAFGMMCGTAWAFDLSPTTGWHSGIAIVGNSVGAPQIAFRGDDGADVWNATVPFTWAAGDVVSFNVRLPIAEWAGSGTVNMLSSNVTEANAGLVVEGLAAGAIAASGMARFNTTKLQRGSVTYSSATGYFTVPVTDYYHVRTNLFGPFTGTPRLILYNVTDSTDVVSGITGATTTGPETGCSIDCTTQLTAGKSYAIKVVGGSYTFYTGDIFNSLQVLRVPQYNTNLPTGFGLAGTDGSAGLYKAGQAPGLATGAVIAAGYIGEVRTFTQRTVTTVAGGDFEANSTPLDTLTAGRWIVHAYGASTIASVTALTVAVATNGTSDGSGLASRSTILGQRTLDQAADGPIMPFVIDVATTQPLYAKANTVGASGSVNIGGFAVRIA